MSLSVENLTMIRGDRPIFRDLSFDLNDGDVLRIDGRNGSGKTTLIRALVGLIPPFSGDIRWNGESILNDPSGLHAQMAFVGHDLALKPGQTVLENLSSWAALYGASNPREAVMTALARFALDPLFDVPVRYLSSGQKRRAALSRLLLAPRKLWLLDEPSVGLDSAATSKLEIAIQDHRSEGGIVIASTHTRLTLLKAKTLDMDDHHPRARKSKPKAVKQAKPKPKPDSAAEGSTS